MAEASLKVAFMGTPDFAVSALQALIDSPHEVVCVYSQPPRPKGRGHKMQKSPVHDVAEKHDIPVFTPQSLKDREAQQEFAAHKVDVAVVAAYGLILPESVLNAPKYGCLNVHASLLPRWRGASPIQHAIWKGDDVSGVTIMQMDKGLDTGDMILKCEIPLSGNTTASGLHDALADMGAKLTLEVLDQLAKNDGVKAEKQDGNLSNYAPLLKKEDGQVDWNNPAIEIDQQVRALNPWPGVWAEIQGKRFKVLDVNLVDVDCPNYAGALCNEGVSPGTILDKNGLILCGVKTVLTLKSIQPEGKKAMDFTSALNGGYINMDEIFS